MLRIYGVTDMSTVTVMSVAFLGISVGLTECCGIPPTICAGQIAGCEAAVHAVNTIFSGRQLKQ